MNQLIKIQKSKFQSKMLINKNTLYVDYNQWLKRLDTQLNEPNNQNVVLKVDKPTNKETLFILTLWGAV